MHSFIQLGQRRSYVGKLFEDVAWWSPGINRWCRMIILMSITNDNMLGFTKSTNFKDINYLILYWPDCSKILKARNIHICEWAILFSFFLESLKTYVTYSGHTLSFISRHQRTNVLHDRLCNITAFICLFGTLLIYEAVTYARVCGTCPANRLSTRRNTQGNKFCLWLTAKNGLFIPRKCHLHMW